MPSHREELQKQQAKERYDKLHMEGKTDEARADLARLALIRKQREDAAKKREEERKGLCKLEIQCGPEDIKLFSCSTEHEISTARKI